MIFTQFFMINNSTQTKNGFDVFKLQIMNSFKRSAYKKNMISIFPCVWMRSFSNWYSHSTNYYGNENEFKLRIMTERKTDDRELKNYSCYHVIVVELPVKKQEKIIILPKEFRLIEGHNHFFSFSLFSWYKEFFRFCIFL